MQGSHRGRLPAAGVRHIGIFKHTYTQAVRLLSTYVGMSVREHPQVRQPLKPILNIRYVMNIVQQLYLPMYPWLYRIYRKLGVSTTRLNAHKHSIIKKYIADGYKEILDKYKDSEYTPQSAISKDCPIWIMWWQGEDAMPDIVRICIASVRKFCGNHEIRLVTKDSYHKYFTPPKWCVNI